MKKNTLLLICCLLFSYGATYAQKEALTSIEDLQKKRLEIGSQTGSVTEYFSMEEIQRLHDFYAPKKIDTQVAERFTEPFVMYAVENISFTVGDIDPENPSVYNPIGPSAPTGNNFEGAGAIDPNNLNTIYVIDNMGELYSVEIPSGIYSYIGNVGVETITGLEFNPVDGVLYAVSRTDFYSIDISGVSATLIGPLGTEALAIALAIDGEGNAYTYDIIDDYLYSIDITTGAATAIGEIGFDADYGQGMAWDVNTNKIYMAAFNVGLFDSQFRIVNTETGATTLVAQMEPGELTQYSWITVPFSPIICNDTTFDSTAVPFDIDGTNSSTPDCTISPNEIPITITNYGILGESATFENVTINITHDFSSDLNLYLISPSGTEIALSEALGGGTINAYNSTVFEDGGSDISVASAPFGTGPYAPTGGTFADTFDGESISGTWMLKICDLTNGNSGQVLQFSMSICVPPSNDVCQFGIPVYCGDTVSGETMTNTDTGGNLAPDAYYSYTGSGGPEEITISLCGDNTDFDSVLRVFDSCNLSNEIVSDNDYCEAQSQVTFTSDGVTTYVIMVEGNGNASGNFDLSVSCVELLVNDSCEGALPISCGEIITGSTVLANMDNNTPPCADASITSPGVWYKFMDDSGLLTDYTISLCGSDFDTKLSVYTGDCGNLVCELANDDFCGTQSQVSFQGNGSTTYYILVHGNEVGNYTLTVDCLPVPPVNDDCNSAIALACGDSINGQTSDATNSGGNEAADEFYSFTGNGQEQLVIISLCNGTIYDSVLRVFDSCDLSNELYFDDDYCGAQSQISFTSDGVSTYFIMVEGFGNSTGNYTLNFTCIDPILNDNCEGALPIECGETVTGSTFGSSMDDAPYCSIPVSSPGVWHKFMDDSGLSSEYTIALCGSEFDTKLSVYSGECGSFVCVAGNDDYCGAQSEVSFQGDGNTTYYILVHSYGGEDGNYTLNVDCQPVIGVPENTFVDFSYYPNPTTEVLYLNSAKIIDHVSIFNMIGQNVMDSKMNSNTAQIDTSTLTTGTYIMKVSINGEIGIYKIIKE